MIPVPNEGGKTPLVCVVLAVLVVALSVLSSSSSYHKHVSRGTYLRERYADPSDMLTLEMNVSLADDKAEEGSNNDDRQFGDDVDESSPPEPMSEVSAALVESDDDSANNNTSNSVANQKEKDGINNDYQGSDQPDISASEPMSNTSNVSSALVESDDNDDDSPNNTSQGTVKGPVRYYSWARRDQSGMQLRRFFELDAIAFANNGIVGGACRNGMKHKKWARREHHIEQFLPILESFGMNETYTYTEKCPSHDQEASGEVVLLPEGHITRYDWKSVFTTEWLEDLRSRFAPPPPPPRDDGRLRVAIHVRRGDISFCNSYSWRYLPNKFFVDLLDEYLPPICGPNITSACHVEVYSQSNHALESFDPFLDRGFTLQLDTGLEETWRAFMAADVLVASRSTFSWSPAFLNPNKVIFPEYEESGGHPSKIPLPGWDVITDDSPLLKAVEKENERLAGLYCH